jgi:hypothetical protein
MKIRILIGKGYRKHILRVMDTFEILILKYFELLFIDIYRRRQGAGVDMLAFLNLVFNLFHAYSHWYLFPCLII